MNLEENIKVDCPYCGEEIALMVDCTAGSQEYIEDCQVCCRPIRLRVSIDADGQPSVTPFTDND